MAVVATLPLAHAQGKDVKTCVAASDSGQVLRDAGKLREAREAFATCAARECPAEISTDCGAWFIDADQRVPSVVVAVRDTSGADVDGARVTIDGVVAPVDRVTQGRRIELDPGRHVVRAAVGTTEAEVAFVLREREKARPVAVTLALHHATAPARPVPALVYVFGATALVATGVGVGFGSSALSRYSELQSSCPRCAEGDRDAARTASVLADVGFGVGIVSAAVATVLFLLRPEVPNLVSPPAPPRQRFERP